MKNLHKHFKDRYEKELKALTQKQLNRKLSFFPKPGPGRRENTPPAFEPQKTSPPGVDFCSNDYLSLQFHTGIRKNLVQALKNPAMPLSGGSSRLIRGTTIWHQELEKTLKTWIKKPCLFFNSGYMAGTGLIATLCKKEDEVFSDQLNHASLIDGCRLSKAKVSVYKHKDIPHLHTLLKKSQRRYKFIITESLFSMDGDFAPLKALSFLSQKYKALLIIDEAHATGIYGPQGQGLSYSLGKSTPFLSLHPCGKALSTGGAFVAAPQSIKKYLINKSRPFIYTTAASPLQLQHLNLVMDTLKENPERRQTLKQKALFFRSQVQKFHPVEHSTSPIVPLLYKGNMKVTQMAKTLQKKGYDIRAIRHPTVPKGKERLRICIHYNHSFKDLKNLAQQIHKAEQKWGKTPPA